MKLKQRARTKSPSEPKLSSIGGSVVVMGVNPARLITILVLSLVAIEISVVVLDYFVNYGRWTDIGAIRRLFNSTREDSLASFISVSQTVLVAATLWFVYAVSCAREARAVTRWSWLVLAIFFSYMAVDDGAMIHERVATALDVLHSEASRTGGAEAGILSSFPSYTWHVVFMPVFGTLGLYMALFLWIEMREAGQRLLVVAGVMALGAAVVLDFIEGLDQHHPLNIYAMLSGRYALSDWTMVRFGESGFETLVHFSKSIEETLEMFGMTMLWAGFLHYLFHGLRSLQLLISPPGVPAYASEDGKRSRKAPKRDRVSVKSGSGRGSKGRGGGARDTAPDPSLSSTE